MRYQPPLSHIALFDVAISSFDFKPYNLSPQLLALNGSRKSVEDADATPVFLDIRICAVDPPCLAPDWLA